MKENIKFVIRVMVIHVLTYLLCGVVFSALFDYTALYQQENINTFMRAVGSASSLIGPVMQVVRGLLFGLILLLLKDSIIGKKYGWLKLWAIIVGIGIINTPGPTPCSIEGIIYTQLPLEFHIKAAPRNTATNFAFLTFCCKPRKFYIPRAERKQNPTDFYCFGRCHVLALRCNPLPYSTSRDDGGNNRHRRICYHVCCGDFCVFGL